MHDITIHSNIQKYFIEKTPRKHDAFDVFNIRDNSNGKLLAFWNYSNDNYGKKLRVPVDICSFNPSGTTWAQPKQIFQNTEKSCVKVSEKLK